MTAFDTSQFIKIIGGGHTDARLVVVGHRITTKAVLANTHDFLQIAVTGLNVENLDLLVSTRGFVGMVVDIDPLSAKDPLLHTQETVAEGTLVTILSKNKDSDALQKSLKMRIENIVTTGVVIKTTAPVVNQVATEVVIPAQVEVAVPVLIIILILKVKVKVMKLRC